MDRLKNPFADADSAAKQEDQTPSSASNDDFLAFSSTSTPAKPHHDSFKIKRGKSNRMGNWERFGAFNQDHQSSPVYKSQRQAWNQDRGSGQNFQPRGSPNNFRGNPTHNNFSPNNFRGNPTHNNFSPHHSPHSDYHQNAYRPFHRGTPRSEPGPRGGNSYRGAPGFFGTPQQNHYNQFQGRGGRYISNPNSDRRGFRGNRGRGRPFNNSKCFDYHSKNEEPWSESGYFHPSMLENPWSDLEVNTNTDSSKTPSSADVSSVKLSDSMIPQVDDTLLERDMDIKKFEDLEEQKGDGNDNSNFSDSSDEDNVVITTGEETRNTQKNISLRPVDILDDSIDSKSSKVGDISKSDSMIPLVGDSILSQNVTLDT